MIEELIFTAKMNVKGRELFVGDICYALRDDKYYGVWGKPKEQGGMYYEDGVIADEDGTYAIAVGTQYGDGCYRGSDRMTYDVDAGVLGVSNMDYLRDTPSLYCGRIVEIPEDCDCNDVSVRVSKTKAGTIRIQIKSNTGKVIFKVSIRTGY